MREFIAATIAMILIAVVAAMVLERFQRGSDVANTTEGAVIHPKDEGISSRGW